jgi:hypothetical protein
MAEDGPRAGAGAVVFLHAVGEHMFHQIVILAHRRTCLFRLAGRLTRNRGQANIL